MPTSSFSELKAGAVLELKGDVIIAVRVEKDEVRLCSYFLASEPRLKVTVLLPPHHCRPMKLRLMPTLLSTLRLLRN